MIRKLFEKWNDCEPYPSGFDGFIFRINGFTLWEVVGVIRPTSDDPYYLVDETKWNWSSRYETKRRFVHFVTVNDSSSDFVGMVRDGTEWDADLCGKSKKVT